MNTIMFGTISDKNDGKVSNVRHIKHSSILACEHAILVPTHYNEDGSCKCNDPEERQMMIKEWGYKAKDFKVRVELPKPTKWEVTGGRGDENAWIRKNKDGAWYHVDVTDMYDHMSEDEAKEGGHKRFIVEVKRLKFSDVGPKEIASALKSCGWELKDGEIINEYDGESVCMQKDNERCMLDACIGYGLGAPLESFEGNAGVLRLMARGRAYADRCARDRDLRAERLARPVNAIGSTAAEYGRGDTLKALYRGSSPEKDILRKMHGIPVCEDCKKPLMQSDVDHYHAEGAPKDQMPRCCVACAEKPIEK